MAILLHKHGAFFDEVFHLPDFFQEPVVCFGFHEIKLKIKKDKVRKPPPPRGLAGRAWRAGVRRARRAVGLAPDRVVVVERAPALPRFSDELRVPDLQTYLARRGVKDVVFLDFFDPRADLRYDMNRPVPASEHERYGTFMDIGCLEHLFDTRQCMENALRMVRPGGTYFLHTPVNGYLGHGLHTFNPEGLVAAVQANGFRVEYERYCAKDGTPLAHPGDAPDSILWLVARKTRPLETFEVPQQGKWYGRYEGEEEGEAPA